MPDPSGLILSFAIVMLAAAVQGAAAFGFALVAVPLLLPLMPATQVVTTSLILGLWLNFLMIHRERRHIAWREIGSLLPASAAGAIAGMLLLRSFNGAAFKAGLSALFLALAVAMLLPPRNARAKRRRGLGQIAGAASGLLTGSTSMGGPPMVLYFAGRRLPKRTLRGTLAVFFLLGNVFALSSFLAAGLITAPVAGKSLILAAAVAPGFFAGRLLTSRLDNDGFRRLVLVAMIVTAAADIGLNLAG